MDSRWSFEGPNGTRFELQTGAEDGREYMLISTDEGYRINRIGIVRSDFELAVRAWAERGQG